MAHLYTTCFGDLEYPADSVLEFPVGLPGFEHERSFVPVERALQRPIVFLQSLRTPELCFLTLPVRVVEPRYQLDVAEPDLVALDLPLGRQPQLGDDVLCLVIVALNEEGPTANLLAPLVINLRNRKGVQAIAPGNQYSHRHPLGVEVV